ncbi:MAG TPA: zf-HC2 domain-containing protein [Candidatus Omnitrophota bacterium]|nr:zf-HC2 domain-containing protein [Candidatus Omnitrophota bacterium]
MECKKIKHWLMTDFLDKEMEQAKSEEIASHLETCADCRNFLEMVRQASVVPFKKAREMQPDPVVWQSLQEKILAEKERSRGWLERATDFSLPFFRISQPAFRVAFVVSLVFMTVVLFKWPSYYVDPSSGYLTEQMTFLDGLRTGNTDLLNEEFRNYDLALETMTG